MHVFCLLARVWLEKCNLWIIQFWVMTTCCRIKMCKNQERCVLTPPQSLSNVFKTSVCKTSDSILLKCDFLSTLEPQNLTHAAHSLHKQLICDEVRSSQCKHHTQLLLNLEEPTRDFQTGKHGNYRLCTDLWGSLVAARACRSFLWNTFEICKPSSSASWPSTFDSKRGFFFSFCLQANTLLICSLQ